MNVPRILAADGLPRRAFTVRDLERMAEAGVIGPDERLELVEGEIIPMSPKGSRHEGLKIELAMLFGETRPKTVTYAQEAGWRLDDETYLEPDFLFYATGPAIEAVRGADAILVIEIADSTLGYDLGRKAGLYAALGVREYWVIDAVRRETHVHRDPVRGGYAAVVVHPAAHRLEAAADRRIALRLADLPER